MTRKKEVVLYFGSFNPIHRGHVALAEWVVEHVACDEVTLIVSPQNPLKADSDLASELARFEMAELACAASRYPERIKPSAIEFLLDKPSYTIHTLRHLRENYGDRMHFQVLIGADLVPQLDRWKESEELLADYPLLVYPRKGCEVTQYRDRITYLADAPLCDCSSTEVRQRLTAGGDVRGMLAPEVLGYIREKGLWETKESYSADLDRRIAADPENVGLLIERGLEHYRHTQWGKALNDFHRALALDPTQEQARQYASLVEEILDFRYKDIYNP